MEHYAAQAFFRVDPAIRHCVDAVTPMLTGIANNCRADPSSLAGTSEDALSAGFGGGITIPLRLPGSALGGFSLVTRMVGQEFLAWHKCHGKWATLAAHAIDQRVLTLAAPQAERPRLSPRERECMTRLAIDLRHDRIAKRIGITRPTVELHLANARRKLKARTSNLIIRGTRHRDHAARFRAASSPNAWRSRALIPGLPSGPRLTELRDDVGIEPHADLFLGSIRLRPPTAPSDEGIAVELLGLVAQLRRQFRSVVRICPISRPGDGSALAVRRPEILGRVGAAIGFAAPVLRI